MIARCLLDRVNGV